MMKSGYRGSVLVAGCVTAAFLLIACLAVAATLGVQHQQRSVVLGARGGDHGDHGDHGNHGNHYKYADVAILNGVPNSVAVRGNKIVAVGSAKSIRKHYVGDATVVYDAGGGLVGPGFFDNHVHTMQGALALSGTLAYVYGADEAGCVQIMLDFAAAHPDDAQVVAQYAFYLANFTRHNLDLVSTTKPVVMFTYDLHQAWANTYLLQLAGLLNAVSEYVPLGADGLATGQLYEVSGYAPLMPFIGEMGMMMAHKLMFLPESLRAQLRMTGTARQHILNYLEDDLKYIASKGITSVHVMDGDWEQLSLYDQLEAEGRLPVRVSMAASIYEPDLPNIDKVLIKNRTRAVRNPKVRSGTCKFWLDGVFDTHTAYTTEPYADMPSTRGKPLWTMDNYVAALRACDDAGLRVATHTIGDGAVRMALDAYEQVFEENDDRDRRWSVEHIELVHPDDVPRFEDLEVVASMQPMHAAQDNGAQWPAEYIAKFPASRYDDTFAWRTLLDAGATMAWSSDWPVVDVDVNIGVMQLTTHRQNFVAGLTDQRVDYETAVDGHKRLTEAYERWSEPDHKLQYLSTLLH
eukprot:TRINITY_DN2490_c0_g1_i1.p1 TRINITY_DN2490_c0_g1~~TRINITY_DN2490_c0_g1_i1.p1  ORF type:complete len:575 (-),score=186.41 TRINITY_DN2490_c0_g1_i1:878-2602(-)